VLDISKSEDELLAAMHPKTRYNVRLAAKKSVTVTEMTNNEGYAIFEKLYFDTTKRQGYRGHLPAYHRNIWKHLKAESHESVESRKSRVESLDSIVIPPDGAPRIYPALREAGIPLPDTVDPRVREDDVDSAYSPTLDIRNSGFDILSDPARLTSRILIASYQGEPLAAFQVWHFKDTIYYTYGGSSEKHRNLMAANLLMWETVRLGRSLGAHTLDMWGSLPPDHDDADPWAGFTRFKSGYGTTFVQYAGSYDLVAYPLLYRLYTFVQNIRAKTL
jgi:lipid II:glycine glycyltransferase (peptidoglycan interpeptide bridge formation enzyme)